MRTKRLFACLISGWVSGGVEVAFGKQIAAADDPEAMRRSLEEQLAKRFSPFTVVENFQVRQDGMGL